MSDNPYLCPVCGGSFERWQEGRGNLRSYDCDACVEGIRPKVVNKLWSGDYVLVPKEPTEAMLNAGMNSIGHLLHPSVTVYQAMNAVAWEQADE